MKRLVEILISVVFIFVSYLIWDFVFTTYIDPRVNQYSIRPLVAGMTAIVFVAPAVIYLNSVIKSKKTS